MPKAKIALAAVLVGSGILLVFEHQATTKLREKNQAMQQQVEQGGRLGEENQRLSNLVAQASNPASLPKDQLGELLRLRGEVGPLRRQKAEVASGEQPIASGTDQPESDCAHAVSFGTRLLAQKVLGVCRLRRSGLGLAIQLLGLEQRRPQCGRYQHVAWPSRILGPEDRRTDRGSSGPEHGEGQRISPSEQAGLDGWGGPFHCGRGSDETKGQVQAETSRVGVEI